MQTTRLLYSYHPIFIYFQILTAFEDTYHTYYRCRYLTKLRNTLGMLSLVEVGCKIEELAIKMLLM